MPEYFAVIKRKSDVRGQTFRFSEKDKRHALKYMMRAGRANSMVEISEYELMEIVGPNQHKIVSSKFPDKVQSTALVPAASAPVTEPIYSPYTVASARGFYESDSRAGH